MRIVLLNFGNNNIKRKGECKNFIIFAKDVMREQLKSLSQVREYIERLKGQLVPMEINKGRNRIVKLKAVIDQVYPSMFVIKTSEKVDLDRMSYSYNDVLCGDIIFFEK